MDFSKRIQGRSPHEETIGRGGTEMNVYFQWPEGFND